MERGIRDAIAGLQEALKRNLHAGIDSRDLASAIVETLAYLASVCEHVEDLPDKEWVMEMTSRDEG